MNGKIENTTVAKKVKYLRENNGLTQDALSSALKIETTLLESIEAGKSTPDAPLLEKMALALQVPLSYLSEQRVTDDNSLNYLTRAMEKLSQNDHDELLQFAEFLQSAPKDK